MGKREIKRLGANEMGREREREGQLVGGIELEGEERAALCLCNPLGLVASGGNGIMGFYDG